MQCPECGGKSLVYGGRDYGTQRQRYRRCRICNHRFATWEEREDRALRPYKTKKTQGDLFGASDEKEGV